MSELPETETGLCSSCVCVCDMVPVASTQREASFHDVGSSRRFVVFHAYTVINLFLVPVNSNHVVDES